MSKTAHSHDPALRGTVALVAGATRGAGRAIAVALGEAGATVYCTGRSSRTAARAEPTNAGHGANPFALAGRPETIEETAERVTAAGTESGGSGIAARVDHTDPAQVQALAARIESEQGRLDVLVNDIWGGEELTESGTPFWELNLDKARALIERAVFTHIVTSRLLVPLMLARGSDAVGGLVIEITDGDRLHYRYNLIYDLVKMAAIRLAFGMAEELRPHGIAALALTPGFLRSEAVLEYFGVTEANWRDAIAKDEHFAASESPAYVGRTVAALAADPNIMAKSGGVYSSGGLQAQYGYTDADGSTPNWAAHGVSHDFWADEQRSADRFLAGFGAARVDTR